MIWILVIGKGSPEANLDIALTARAFGASSITFLSNSRKPDQNIIRHIKGVNKKWGGKFSISFSNNWKEFLKSKKNYIKIYLTRYGVPIKKVEYALKTYKNILIVVSMTESIKSLYKNCDFNVSITTQPHTCASSIAVFLHNFYNGRELAMHFENAKYKVVPEEHNIHVEKFKQSS